MGEQFLIHRTNRSVYANFLEKFTAEQLNSIPSGFPNNIIWNIGHVVAVQQMLVYGLSGLPMLIDEDFLGRYRNGSRPNASVEAEEIAEIKHLLVQSSQQMEQDFATGIFQNFQEYTTKTGFKIQHARDAIAFNNYHEGIHLGIIMGLKKFIG